MTYQERAVKTASTAKLNQVLNTLTASIYSDAAMSYDDATITELRNHRALVSRELSSRGAAEATAQRITDQASDMANQSVGKFGTDQKYIASRYSDAALLWRKAGNARAAENCEKRAAWHASQKVG
jgi:hypothetical protein